MEELNISYNTACASNARAKIVFQEASKDVELASKEVERAIRIEKSARTWAAIAEAKLEDTVEAMKITKSKIKD